MYYVRFASAFTSNQIFLQLISLYLGASLTHRISLNLSNFFYPDNTFLAKEVVISRPVGQYLKN